MVQKNCNNYYDLETLRKIPIEDVCYQLGFNVIQKGSKSWIKLRNEKTVSAIINKDKNTIYDFGDPYIFGTTNTGGPKQGDTLDLIQYVYSCDFIEAKEILASMFNIQPVNSNRKNANSELTYQDYLKIGIYGDKASKNINFDPSMSLQELFELADIYSISVNELKTSKNEELLSIYEEVILRGRALPYIQQMRNTYFVTIWEQYSFLKDIDAIELFDTVCSQEELTEMYTNIISAEKIFNRAAEGTKVRKISTRDYSPEKILTDILENRIKPELGTLNYKRLNQLAKAENCGVKYEVIDLGEYYKCKSQLDERPHRAIFKDEQILLGYLSRDINEIRQILPGENSLDEMVTYAEKRKKYNEKDINYQKTNYKGIVDYENYKS